MVAATEPTVAGEDGDGTVSLVRDVVGELKSVRWPIYLAAKAEHRPLEILKWVGWVGRH